MPSVTVREARPALQFWLLAALLVLIFLTGGSSRADVQSLQVLRPIAIIAAAYGLFTTTFEQFRQYRHLYFIVAAVLSLIASHLIPLSPGTWHALPGRGIMADIDSLAGLRDQWRPLSMVPVGTMNALYSLSVPVAVLSLAIQLGSRDHVRLLLLLVALTIVSGAFVLLQAIGANVQLYALSSETAGLFANRNHQGVLLALLFPMLAVAATRSEGVLNRRLAPILAGVLAAIAIPLILVSGSRAAMVVAVLALLLVPVIGLKGLRSWIKRNRYGSILGFGFAGAAIVALVGVTIFVSRATAVTRLEQGEGELRLPVWASIVDALPVYLPWGSGVGSYVNVYQILEPDRLLRPTFSNHAHNEWLEIALTAGWPGLAILAWAIALFIYAGWRALRGQGQAAAFSRLGLGIVLLLAIASTVDYPVRTPIMASVLAIAAVWACSFRGFGNEDGCR